MERTTTTTTSNTSKTTQKQHDNSSTTQQQGTSSPVVVKASECDSLGTALMLAHATSSSAKGEGARLRTMLVHCVSESGVMHAAVERRMNPLWVRKAREAWRKDAADHQLQQKGEEEEAERDEDEGLLGEIQMAKVKKQEEASPSSKGLKLWVINAITHSSSSSSSSSSSLSLASSHSTSFSSSSSADDLGRFSSSAFESAMSMVAAIARVRKAAVVLAIVARSSNQGVAERRAIMQAIRKHLVAKKLRVVIYEIEEHEHEHYDKNGKGQQSKKEKEKQEEKKVKEKRNEENKMQKKGKGKERKLKRGKPNASSTVDEDSGSETEDMDDEGLEELLKGIGKFPVRAKAMGHSKKDEKKPASMVKKTEEKKTTTTPKGKQKQGEEGRSGSDTEEMDLDAVPQKQKSSKSDQLKKQPYESGSDTEGMDLDAEAIEPKRTGQKRKRGHRNEKEKEEQPENNKSDRASCLLRGVSVVILDHNGESHLRLQELVETMGGFVSKEWVPYGGRASTHLLVPSSYCDASEIPHLIVHADKLGAHIVRERWVEDCWHEKRRLDELLYTVAKGHLEEEEEEKMLSLADDDSDGEQETDVPQSCAAAPSTQIRELPSILDGFSLFFHGYNKQNDFPASNKSELERYAVAYGADVYELLAEDTPITHIVSWVDRGQNRKLAALLANAGRHVKVVNPLWVWDSINTSSLRPEQPYLISVPHSP